MKKNNFDLAEFVNFAISQGVVKYFEDPIQLKSGQYSQYYVNWRSVSSSVSGIDALSRFVISYVSGLGIEVDSFLGVPEGASSLGIITQYKWAFLNPPIEGQALPMGRAKPKEHGDPQDRFFVGAPKGKTVLIEDVTTTGGSLISFLEVLQASGIDVVAAVGLTNREALKDGRELIADKLKAFGVEYYSLCTLDDLSACL